MDSDSEKEQSASIDEVSQDNSAKRGKPAGKADQKPRYRRTAQEISDDKIRIAQMRLDALRETEEKRLSSKKLEGLEKRQLFKRLPWHLLLQSLSSEKRAHHHPNACQLATDGTLSMTVVSPVHLEQDIIE